MVLEPRRRRRQRKSDRERAKMDALWDDPMRALARAEQQAANDSFSRWHYPLTESQEQAILGLLERRGIVPPRDPHVLRRIEATRWLTWLRVYGELPPEA